MRMKSIYGFGVILGLALLTAEAPATTYYVATNGLDSNNGQSWETPFLTISNAVKIAQTNADNVVLVSNGTYLTAAQILITNAITLRSWNNGAVDRTNTVVQRSGAAKHRIFYISNTEAVVEGFTITNGNAATTYYEGTGVWLDRGGTIRNCLITGNTGGYNYAGGAVLINQTGTLDNCVLIGNSGWFVGGIHMPDGGLVTNCQVIANACTYITYPGGIRAITGCVVVASTIISNATGGYGGGITVGTNSVVRDCTISYNTSVSGGGGVSLGAGGLVDDCTIQYNSSPSGRSGAGILLNPGSVARNCLVEGNIGTNGGGLYFSSGGVARNCLIKGNTGTNGGGVYFASDGYAGGKLQNCTVVSNLAALKGGGIWQDARFSSNAPILVENCISYQNFVDAGTSSNVYNYSGSYYAYSNSCVAPTNGLLGANNISLNPQFVDWAGDYRLARGSPCVNAGLNQEWMTGVFDLDGHARIDRYSGIVDMGAYEYVFPGTTFIIY